ncbi:hypothetical protein ACA910_014206 [Epithemia clementina (nom. ined.)]
MVKELSYGVISHVVDTWEMAKRTPAFEEKAGYLILEKLFDLEPRTKPVFGFERNADVSACPRLQIGVLIHSKRLVRMLDTALDLIGPDTEMLTEVLEKLGRRHVQYGVKAGYLPFMGQAIFHALEQILGNDVWRDEVKEAWEIVYEEFSKDIMKAILSGERMDELHDGTTSVRIAL